MALKNCLTKNYGEFDCFMIERVGMHEENLSGVTGFNARF